MSFEVFWKTLQEQLTVNTVIKNWTVVNGYLGDDFKIILNGTVILEGNVAEASKNGTLDGKDHPGLMRKKGYLAFLGHGSELRFRNIRIKDLSKE